MAGVKTQRGGTSRKPNWHPSRCTLCGEMIEWQYGKDNAKIYPATRVQVVGFTGAKGSRRFEWRHKGCVK